MNELIITLLVIGIPIIVTPILKFIINFRNPDNKQIMFGPIECGVSFFVTQ